MSEWGRSLGIDASAIALAGMAAGERFTRAAVHHLAMVEDVTVRLMMVTEPAAADAVAAEVERRTALFEEIRRASPRDGEPAKLAALRSVYEDAIAGRLS